MLEETINLIRYNKILLNFFFLKRYERVHKESACHMLLQNIMFTILNQREFPSLHWDRWLAWTAAPGDGW